MVVFREEGMGQYRQCIGSMLSVGVCMKKSLTAQACSNVNCWVSGSLAKSMTVFRALRHTASNKSIAF